MKIVQTIQGGEAVMLTDHQRAMADLELQHKSAMATLQRKYDQLHESWRLLQERPSYTLVGVEGDTVILQCDKPISYITGSYVIKDDFEEGLRQYYGLVEREQSLNLEALLAGKVRRYTGLNGDVLEVDTTIPERPMFARTDNPK